MAITAYNIKRNGTASEIRFVRSTISHDRLILIKDSVNLKMYVFYGKNIHSETKRLGAYTVEELLEDGYELIEVGIGDWDSTKDMIYSMIKNPNATTISEQIKETKTEPIKDSHEIEQKVNTTTIKKKKKDEIKTPKMGLFEATTQEEIEAIRMKIKEEASEEEKLQAKYNIQKAGGHAPLPPQEILQDQANLKIKKSDEIPMPARKFQTPKNLDAQFMPKAEYSAGPMIAHFQISYYEKSGGTNYILIHELNEKIGDEQFELIKDFIQVIDDMSKDDTSKDIARQVLAEKLDTIINHIYRK